MRIIGRWRPQQPKEDKTVFYGRCPDINCRCEFQFNRSDIEIVKPEPKQFKGEFGRMQTYSQPPYYGVKCPSCHEYIYLGNEERDILQHISNSTKRRKAIAKYDEENTIDYD